MTNDTDEYDNTYQININLEKDEDNKYKAFYEKGLSALLDDPHFLLLYVPRYGVKMHVIQPASDPYHLKRIIKRINEAERIPSFYYALSHLWALTSSKQHYWNDISEYVYDEKGQPIKPIPMRLEKRDTLLALLKDHPDSYWWIDVLCARTDTPLDIMGDIYACCLECIAMTDCEPTLIPQLHSMMDAREEFSGFYYWGEKSLDELLPYKQLYDKKYPQLLNHLLALFECQWWKRVWTWQEMALPLGEVRLMAETATHISPNNTITVDDIYSCFSKIMCILRLCFQWDIVQDASHRCLSEAVAVLRMLTVVRTARIFNNVRIRNASNVYQFTHLMRSLGNSTRRCKNPVDYVYGILGMLHFQIPRLTDTNHVWCLFLSELDNYIKNIPQPSYLKVKVSADAYKVDLRKAKSMADVYKDLLKVSS